MIEYKLIRSKRKTVSIMVTENSEVVVRVPLQSQVKDIEKLVAKHLDWIEKSIRKTKAKNASAKASTLTDAQITELKQKAKEYLPERVAYFSDIMDGLPAEVKITSAKRHWGSCIHRNSKDNICFSYRVMLLPADLIDYIVVHELSHIRVKDHSKRFYEEVAKYMPDYQERTIKLKQMNQTIS